MLLWKVSAKNIIKKDRQGSEARKYQEKPLRIFSRLYERQ